MDNRVTKEVEMLADQLVDRISRSDSGTGLHRMAIDVSYLVKLLSIQVEYNSQVLNKLCELKEQRRHGLLIGNKLGTSDSKNSPNSSPSAALVQ